MEKTLKMPLPYISYSAWALFQKSPVEYYQQYFIGRIDKPTPRMLLGKIFQEAWSDPKYDYVKELKKVGFTSDYERIIRTALNHKQTVRLPKHKCERKHIVRSRELDHPIMAVFDGEDKPIQLLVENKLGHVWTQHEADTSEQITWYVLAWKIKYRTFPKNILLQSFNGKNGLPTLLWTKRAQYDLDELTYRINQTVAKIKAGEFN